MYLLPSFSFFYGQAQLAIANKYYREVPSIGSYLYILLAINVGSETLRRRLVNRDRHRRRRHNIII